MKGYYKIVKAELLSLGFSVCKGRGKGSHEMWALGSKRIPVPHNMQSRHTANGILKSAGSSKKI